VAFVERERATRRARLREESAALRDDPADRVAAKLLAAEMAESGAR